MCPAQLASDKSDFQIDKVLGLAVIEVIPTEHLRTRFSQRIGDIMPEIDPARRFRISGVLLKSRRSGYYYLDVGGVGRFVLSQHGDAFVGVTVLPRIYCHPVEGGVEDA